MTRPGKAKLSKEAVDKRLRALDPTWSEPEPLRFAELVAKKDAVSYTHLTLPTNREV